MLFICDILCIVVNNMNNRERAIDHKCPGCGSRLTFRPESGKWKCDNCNGEYDLETLKKFNNASSEVNNDKSSDVEDTNYVEYHCKDCGAEIIADENTASTFCVYCGNTAILKSKLSGKFAPSKIIPFKKTKEEAIEAFKSISKGKPLTPKFFNKKENIEKVSGVYIPFWLFSIETKASISVSGTKVQTWRNGDTEYTKTDTYDIERDGVMKYDRIPVDGSKRFDDAMMNTIEPFKYEDMVDYNHAYLSGFLAEKYDVESDECEKIADKRAETTAQKKIMDSITGYASTIIKASKFDNIINNKEYVLLPVWMVNVKYNEKYYTFAMNAQTGKFIGDTPISKPKVVAFSIISFLLIVGVIILISYLIYKGGH